MTYSRPVVEIIQARFSCRAYAREPLPEELRDRLGSAASVFRRGTLGSAVRYQLLAAEEGDRSALRGLGSYGVIRNPAGFLAGAVRRGGKYLEDYGHGMECLILAATDLGLGTCWLGGFFTRGPFSRRIALTPQERIPAVASVGVIADPRAARDGLLRRLVHADQRLPWDRLFFDGSLDAPLTRGAAGQAAEALEMVRLAPSASNRQPWRVVRQGRRWHFLLRRSAGYGGGSRARLIRVEDLQRVDMGIAMCHFELVRREAGSAGRWVVQPPELELPDPLTEYVASWED